MTPLMLHHPVKERPLASSKLRKQQTIPQHRQQALSAVDILFSLSGDYR
ncbi:MAG: hypothetical protein SFZ03_09045 [Candidatus Melainabacteria bacterium]|nr:hypothetical protein [Candidatus Melainabacteria bacterium]